MLFLFDKKITNWQLSWKFRLYRNNALKCLKETHFSLEVFISHYLPSIRMSANFSEWPAVSKNLKMCNTNWMRKWPQNLNTVFNTNNLLYFFSQLQNFRLTNHSKVVVIYPHITLQVAQRRMNIFCLRRATCNVIWG